MCLLRGTDWVFKCNLGYMLYIDLRTNSDCFPIQRWAVGSSSGNRVNAAGVWDPTLYSPMSHDVSEEPATFVMIVHYNAASPTMMMKLAGFFVCTFRTLQCISVNVRTLPPHSTAIPNVVNLIGTVVTSDMTRRSMCL